jgi:hypothetical protein
MPSSAEGASAPKELVQSLRPNGAHGSEVLRGQARRGLVDPLKNGRDMARKNNF